MTENIALARGQWVKEEDMDKEFIYYGPIGKEGKYKNPFFKKTKKVVKKVTKKVVRKRSR